MVMAAVNAGAPAPAPAVREHLAGRTIPVLSELRNFVDSHRQKGQIDWSAYVSFALTSGEAPHFKPSLTGIEEPPDLARLEGFRALLIRFYREAALQDLWAKVKPSYTNEISKYHGPVTRALAESNGYMVVRQAAIWEGVSSCTWKCWPPRIRLIRGATRTTISSSSQVRSSPRIPEVRHLYLHYLLNRSTAKYSDSVMKRRSFERLRSGRRRVG